MRSVWSMAAGAAFLSSAAAAQAQAPSPPAAPPPPEPRAFAPQGYGMVSNSPAPAPVTVMTAVPGGPRAYQPIVLVREGTAVALRIAEDFAARARPLEPGDRVRLEVAEPVRGEAATLVPRPGGEDGQRRLDIGPSVPGRGGIVLVPAGRPVTAEVVEASGASVTLRLVSVYVDGQDVPLRGEARGRLASGTAVRGVFADHFVPAQPLMPAVGVGTPIQVLEPPRPHAIAIPARMPPPDPRIAAPPRPKAPLAALIAEADYPEPALRAREQGEVTVILEVAPTGRVVTCVVTYPARSDALNAASCRLLHARARFTPARDTSGNAVAAWLEHKILWSLPGGR